MRTILILLYVEYYFEIFSSRYMLIKHVMIKNDRLQTSVEKKNTWTSQINMQFLH